MRNSREFGPSGHFCTSPIESTGYSALPFQTKIYHGIYEATKYSVSFWIISFTQFTETYHVFN